MVNITIDARFYGPEHTGLGRYTQNVLTYLPKYLSAHRLKILLRTPYFDTLSFPAHCTKIRCDLPHYSLVEQLLLPKLLRTTSTNLFYTFHFNAPILSHVPTIVTIHDLIKTHFTGRDTTTHAAWLYALKRFGYNQVIRTVLSQAKDIIVPTIAVKADILSSFPAVDNRKIHPIPEAPDAVFRTNPQHIDLPKSLPLPSRYLLFVGNAYPHKNLGLLLDAFTRLADPSLSLVLVAKESPFLSRLLVHYSLDRIKLLPPLSDSDLAMVYKRAEALVTPSLMEGYGLVGLEALMVGTPVLASDIPVYHEVFGSKVTYFDPHSVTSLLKLLAALPPHKHPQPPFVYERTWDQVAKDIAEVMACA